MRSLMMKSVLLAGAGLLAAGSVANASERSVLDVKVPFPFVVNGRSFPAGEYVVERDDSWPAVLLIRGENGIRAGGFVTTEPAEGHDPAGTCPALTFTRSADQYQLSSIWESADQGSSIVNRSAAHART